MENLYKFIDNIIFKALNFERFTGKYKPFKELENFGLHSNLKPLLQYFTQEQLQSYCKWKKQTDKIPFSFDKEYDKRTFEYRGFKFTVNKFKADNSSRYFEECVYLKKDLEYSHTTSNIVFEIIGCKMNKKDTRTKMTIHRYIPQNLSHKQLKIEFDKIIKDELR